VPDLPPLAARVLETPRLRLEPLVAAHAPEVFLDLVAPGLHEFIPRGPPASLEALSARFARLEARRSPDGQEGWLNWVARRRDEGDAVGLFEATVRPGGEALVAWTVFFRAQRQGFAREGAGRMIAALRAEGLARRVVALVDPRNVASRRLALALGLADEGREADGDVRYAG
jgi:RimJ/RimL family protein N-acetyltransferase